MILLVCWHRILGDDVYLDDFDIETGHGINVTEEKKSTWPDRDEPRSSPLPCENSSQTINPRQFSPCLNRYVPESAQNRAGTNETRLSHCCSRSEHTPTLSHQMSLGRLWGEVQGPTGIRTEDLSAFYSARRNLALSFKMF